MRYCKLCNKDTLAHNFTRHAQQHNNQHRRKCSQCNITVSGSNWARHLRTHGSKEPPAIQASSINISTPQASPTDIPTAQALPVTKYCDLCKKQIPKQNFGRHQQAHNGQHRKVCTLCHILVSGSRWARHLKTKTHISKEPPSTTQTSLISTSTTQASPTKTSDEQPCDTRSHPIANAQTPLNTNTWARGPYRPTTHHSKLLRPLQARDPSPDPSDCSPDYQRSQRQGSRHPTTPVLTESDERATAGPSQRSSGQASAPRVG